MIRILLAGVIAIGLVACSSPGQDTSPNSNLADGTVLPKAEGLCAPGEPALELSGNVSREQQKTYILQPFEVAAGSQRVEVAYTWGDSGSGNTPVTQTVFDLGLWDENGFRNDAGFRGWSGSRQGRIHADQDPVFVQSDAADRSFEPGPINPGEWAVELGVAAVAPDGANWQLVIECKGVGGGATPVDDPVDPNHVANASAGWYQADFHMHAFHSNPNAPDWDDFIAQARTGNVDVLVVTEYITGQHWRTLGALQRAHPDLLIWPGREIITYFGHANTLGETFGVFEYRHGFEDVALAEIQRRSVAAGALFQVNHPETFRGAAFENFCRGCAFELGDEIDWGLVDTIEVHNAAILVTGADIGIGFLPGQIQNPFTQPAIDLWEDKLNEGFFITATSGSDSKGVDDEAERTRKGYGSSSTAIFADNLSRPAITAALKAGRAYIRTRGVAGSPEVDMTATANSETVMFGGSLAADSATLDVNVRDGANQRLRLLVNGAPFLEVPITSADFSQSFPIQRNPATEGPLGTHWRIDVLDEQSLTIIGNPIFLTGNE